MVGPRDRVFYVDAGMRIWKPIKPMIELDCEGVILAHTDAWPTYYWKLKTQFHEVCLPPLHAGLCYKLPWFVELRTSSMHGSVVTLT